MPELPEVETSRRGIDPYLCGNTVTETRIRQPMLRWPVSEQIISGQRDVLDNWSVFMPVQGILPQLTLGQSVLEALFRETTGAPAESRWGEAFSDALLKRGVTPMQFLQDFARGLDLDESYAHLRPQGVTFQAGW